MSVYFAMSQAAFVMAWRLKLRLHDLLQEFVRSEELGLVLAKDLTSELQSAHHTFKKNTKLYKIHKSNTPISFNIPQFYVVKGSNMGTSKTPF